MGKGFNNFMSKKGFHPASFANQKRIHEAEAKAEAKKKHDEETLAQYQKEQELYNQTSLVSKESKAKLALSFMYDAPPGFKKSEDTKPSDKIEWTGSNATKRFKTEPGQGSSKIDHDDHDEPVIMLEWKRDRPRVKREPRLPTH